MRQLLSAQDLADLLGASPRTTQDRRWRERVGLRALRVGGLLRFRVEDVQRLLAEGQIPVPLAREANPRVHRAEQ